MIKTSQNRQIMTKKVELSITQTIFHWHSTYQWPNNYPSPYSHCLVRIYWLKNESEAVIIASSLNSNEGNTDIYDGYYDLATKLMQEFPQLKSMVNSIAWLAHSGQFSYELSWSESHKKEDFTEMKLEFDKNYESQEIIDSQEIEVRDVIKMLDGAYLEPVIEVLQKLEHDNGWGEIVNDLQVKACHELAEGIIFGEKRAVGLVGW